MPRHSRPNPARSQAPITLDTLARLGELADADLADRCSRRPRWTPYRGRRIAVALCQGAVLHYADGRNGVKDLDLYSFFAHDETGPFPWRWRTETVFREPPFDDHPVDFMGRSLRVDPDAEPVEAIQRYLSDRLTPTAREFAEKAVVLIEPDHLRGQVIWARGEPVSGLDLGHRPG
jgi:hypothetical protein